MHRVGFFVFPDHQILDFAGPFAVFDTAARLSGRPLYALGTLSPIAVACRSWTRAADHAHPDTLVGGGGDISFMLKVGEVQAGACLARGASRIASVCTGPFLLTEAVSSV